MLICLRQSFDFLKASVIIINLSESLSMLEYGGSATMMKYQTFNPSFSSKSYMHSSTTRPVMVRIPCLLSCLHFSITYDLIKCIFKHMYCAYAKWDKAHSG